MPLCDHNGRRGLLLRNSIIHAVSLGELTQFGGFSKKNYILMIAFHFAIHGLKGIPTSCRTLNAVLNSWMEVRKLDCDREPISGGLHLKFNRRVMHAYRLKEFNVPLVTLRIVLDRTKLSSAVRYVRSIGIHTEYYKSAKRWRVGMSLESFHRFRPFWSCYGLMKCNVWWREISILFVRRWTLVNSSLRLSRNHWCANGDKQLRKSPTSILKSMHSKPKRSF
jgi:hypothetical protein